MLTVVIPAGNEPIQLVERESRPLQAGEVRIKLKAAALNHRDLWIALGQYGPGGYPVQPGSDGAGVVTEGDANWLGREVIVNPSLNWGDREDCFGNNFGILGMPSEGTFAQEIVVPVSQLAEKPVHLSWEQAAALPLAGLTAYRGLFSRARLKPGETALVTGIGGGVAMFGLQFAVAAGAKVVVTSSGPEKIEKAKSLGAAGGVSYRDADWADQVLKKFGPVDVILDGTAGEPLGEALRACRRGARISCYGVTGGAPRELPWRLVFWNQLTIHGTTMGSPADFTAMTEFVDRHKITPVVDEVFPLRDAARAFEKMKLGSQQGKLVLAID